MFSQYLEEFEVEEIGVDQFIERLTRRARDEFEINFLEGTGTELLAESFLHTINDLKVILERSQKKCVVLEEQLASEKKAHRQQLEPLENQQYVRL